MKKLTLALLAAAAFGFAGCEVEKDIDTEEYSFDVTVPISASGAGQVESIVDQDLNFEGQIADATDGKANLDDVSSIRVKEARIEVGDADNENNIANFSKATLTIGAETVSEKVTASRDIPDEFSNQVNFGDAFGDQDLRRHVGISDDIQYKVLFDARRATAKELHAQLKITFVMHVKYKVYGGGD